MIWHTLALPRFNHELLLNFVDQPSQQEIVKVTEFELLMGIMEKYGLPGIAICLSIFSLYRVAIFLKPLITALSERFIALLTRLIAEIERNEEHRNQLLQVLKKHQEGIQELLDTVRGRQRRGDRQRDSERLDDGD